LKQQSSKIVDSSDEPDAKRAKVDDNSEAESTLLPERSLLNVQAMEFIPKTTASTLGEKNPVAEGKNNGEVDGDDGQIKEVEEGEGASESAKEINVVTSAPASAPMASVFGNATGAKLSFGSSFGTGGSTPAFGQTSVFGTGTGFAGLTAQTGSSSFFGGGQKADSASAPSSGFGSSAFLDIKPPGSSTAPPHFSFGTSSNIKLPTPANPSPQTSIFNAFSSPSPFGGVGANQTSGISSSKPLFSTEEEKAESTKNSEETEEGEMEDTEEK
jgi:hypothetical protein